MQRNIPRDYDDNDSVPFLAAIRGERDAPDLLIFDIRTLPLGKLLWTCCVINSK